MPTQFDEGITTEEFKSEIEYLSRLHTLEKSMGRSKLFYSGWLNGKLVIMHR